MRDQLQADWADAAGRANVNARGSTTETANGSGDTGNDEDRGRGTGHRAGQGARTGPTRGRGQRRLVAFLGGIDVCSGVL